MKLRDYQEKSVQQIQELHQSGVNSIVLVAPTGSGKTVMFTDAARRHLDSDPSNSVITFTHREELLNQAVSKFAQHGIQVGTCSAGTPIGSGRAWVSTVGSAQHVLQNLKPTMVIWDECHHAVSDSWLALKQQTISALHLGVTATPERLDGKPLGNAFQSMIVSQTVRQLTEAGFLAKTQIFSPNKPSKDWAQHPVDEWLSRAGGKKTIGFFKSRVESETIAEAFRAKGISAVHVDATTKDRAHKLALFAEGEITVVCNVGLFLEGVDIASCKSVIFGKRVTSQCSWLQGCGRSMRPDGNDAAIIIDLCGSVWLHGSPSLERVYSLEKGIQIKNKSLMPMRCPKCSARLYPGAINCPSCDNIIADNFYQYDPKSEFSSVENVVTTDCSDITPIDHDEQHFKLLCMKAKMLKKSQKWIWFSYKQKTGQYPPKHFLRFFKQGALTVKKHRVDDIDEI
jgi:DNA repair protein RadD